MNLAVSLLERGRDDAVALVADGVAATYADLREAVARAAGAWRALGVAPGERVAITLADDSAWVAAKRSVVELASAMARASPGMPATRD